MSARELARVTIERHREAKREALLRARQPEAHDVLDAIESIGTPTRLRTRVTNQRGESAFIDDAGVDHIPSGIVDLSGSMLYRGSPVVETTMVWA